MFFINALKDYIDHINDIVFILNENFSVFTLFKSTITYIFNSLSLVFIYLISFKWLTDFIEWPATFRESYLAILEGKNVYETLIELQTDTSIFSFFNNTSLNTNNFFTGFFNSLFLMIPFSAPHVVTIRALLINGLPAGVSSCIGLLLGQFLFFICILFGFEFVIVPFLTFEPLSTLLGLYLLSNTLFNSFHNPQLKPINLSDKKKLLKLFGFSFILSWTEQNSMYNYFSNLTVTNASNALQTNNNIDFFILNNIFYVSGIVIGSLILTSLFGIIIMYLFDQISNNILYNISYSRIKYSLHYITLFLTIIACLATIPYYGLDYLITNPLGFIYHDSLLINKSPKTGFYQSKKLKRVVEKKNENKKKDDPIAMAAKDNFSFDINDFQNGMDNVDSIKYEDYSVLSESGWINRYPLKMSDSFFNGVNKVQYKRFTTDKKYKIVDFEIPEYETKNLTLIEEKKIEKINLKNINKNIKWLILERVFDEIFRDDAYYGYFDIHSVKPDNRVQLHRIFRQNYYNNPFYKALLSLELYPFLSGQPKTYNQTVDDEIDLYTNLIFIQHYIKSIYEYEMLVKRGVIANNSFNKKLLTKDLLNKGFKITDLSDLDLMNLHSLTINPKTRNIPPGLLPSYSQNKGTQNKSTQLRDLKFEHLRKERFSSFAKKVYNQQFKGSLCLIRQFNAINLNFDMLSQFNTKKVLKFDQPQYQVFENEITLFDHEELNETAKVEFNETAKVELNETAKVEFNETDYFKNLYMKSISNTPLYIGWDSSLRKFLIRTSTLPTTFDNFSNSHENNISDELVKEFPNYFTFKAWSPGMQKIKNNFNYILKLPTLELSNEKLEELMEAFEWNLEIIEKKPLISRQKFQKKKKIKANLKAGELLLKRLPTYDWYWAKDKMELNIKDPKSLNLGKTLPTRLDGIAWPGVKDPIIIKKLTKKTKNKNENKKKDKKTDPVITKRISI